MSQRALKITAAHELCHIILDHKRTLAEVDISDGRVVVPTEGRANAFAAEFMLPARTAVTLWRQSSLAQSCDGVSLCPDRLSDRFDVSRVVAARRLQHGPAGSNPEILYFINELIRR